MVSAIPSCCYLVCQMAAVAAAIAGKALLELIQRIAPQSSYKSVVICPIGHVDP